LKEIFTGSATTGGAGSSTVAGALETFEAEGSQPVRNPVTRRLSAAREWERLFMDSVRRIRPGHRDPFRIFCPAKIFAFRL
jgi:hypothetical protein